MTDIKDAYNAALAAKLQSKIVTDFVTLVVGEIKTKLQSGQLSKFGEYEIPQNCPNDANFWAKAFAGTDLIPRITPTEKLIFTIQ